MAIARRSIFSTREKAPSRRSNSLCLNLPAVTTAAFAIAVKTTGGQIHRFKPPHNFAAVRFHIAGVPLQGLDARLFSPSAEQRCWLASWKSRCYWRGWFRRAQDHDASINELATARLVTMHSHPVHARLQRVGGGGVDVCLIIIHAEILPLSGEHAV